MDGGEPAADLRWSAEETERGEEAGKMLVWAAQSLKETQLNNIYWLSYFFIAMIKYHDPDNL